MALTTMNILELTPRGGVAGQQVTVDGDGFGAVAGTVRFDPLGFNVGATIVSWLPNQVIFIAPIVLDSNVFFDVVIETAGGGDSIITPFWYPRADLQLGTTLPLGLDYQWPNFEADTATQNDDDPRIFSAADFNKLMDTVVENELRARQSVDPKDSCQAATELGVDLAGTYLNTGGAFMRGQLTGMPNTLDGVTLIAGMRILVKDQTNQDENGIYNITTLGTGSDGVWDRAEDFATDEQVTSGALTFVIAGTENAESSFVVVTPDPITIGGASGTAIIWAATGNPLPPVQDLDTGSVGFPTAGDNAGTGVTLSNTPFGVVNVSIDGVGQRLGNGIKTLDCYISGDGGVNARAFGSFAAGDTLFWNGTIAGFNLLPTYTIGLEYVR